ncbi:zinc finger protein ZFP2-like [Lineus longissimus]|uniref:zinc finger protein ZFP2-like n=1 Tax=Lineus longissimus TaxID=88925 RepID=UPI00315DA196
MEDSDTEQVVQPVSTTFIKEEPIDPEEYETEAHDAEKGDNGDEDYHPDNDEQYSDSGTDSEAKEHDGIFVEGAHPSEAKQDVHDAKIESLADGIKTEPVDSPELSSSIGMIEHTPGSFELEHSGQSSSSHGEIDLDNVSLDDKFKPRYLGGALSDSTIQGVDSSRRRNMRFANNPLKCKHCDGTFVSRKDLICHEREHLGLKPYKCEHCDKIFSGVGGLNRHLRIHTGEKPFQCDYCEKSFALKGNLVKHYENIHIGEKSYKCECCEKTFKQSSHLTTHSRIHTGERPYSCQYCGRAFSSHSNLTAHERTHTGERPYSCGICHKTFKRRTDLKRHESVHTGETPFVCRYCNKSVLCQRTLTNHEALHFREKVEHKCELCKRVFSNGYLLKKHARMHETNYECQFCGKVFARSSHLQSHLRIHTGEKPYSCKHCGQVFSAPSNLIAHERIHTGEKPFKCKLCDKAFTAQSNLIAHEQTHSDTKPYGCDLCDKCFKQSSKLKKHVKKHHPEAVPLRITSGPIPVGTERNTWSSFKAPASKKRAAKSKVKSPKWETSSPHVTMGMLIKKEPVDASDHAVEEGGSDNVMEHSGPNDNVHNGTPRAATVMEGAIESETGDLEEFSVGIANYSNSGSDSEMMYDSDEEPQRSLENKDRDLPEVADHQITRSSSYDSKKLLGSEMLLKTNNGVKADIDESPEGRLDAQHRSLQKRLAEVNSVLEDTFKSVPGVLKEGAAS